MDTGEGQMTRDNKVRCRRKVPRPDGGVRMCSKDGTTYRIAGEFGSFIEVLCSSCATAVRLKGWKVTPLSTEENADAETETRR
jgi:hypothetical protein